VGDETIVGELGAVFPKAAKKTGPSIDDPACMLRWRSCYPLSAIFLYVSYRS